MCTSHMTLSVWEFLIKVKREGVTLTGEAKGTAPKLPNPPTIYNLNIISHPLSVGDRISDAPRFLCAVTCDQLCDLPCWGLQ